MTSENEPDYYVEGLRLLATHIKSLPHADVLNRFALELYTPEIHNEMVEALRSAGVEGDLDIKAWNFANQPPGVTAVIVKRAKELRAAQAPEETNR
jgi:hypothetical protein